MIEAGILEIANLVMKLKTVPRTGWVRDGVNPAESVADHSYGVALLAMIIAPHYDVDSSKVIAMALIHDLAEAKVGDIVTQRGTSTLSYQDDKLAKERLAVSEIFEPFEMQLYVELFDEYLKNESAEAKLVHQIDKLEMALQAGAYRKQTGLDLDEFFHNANKHIVEDNLRRILIKADEQSKQPLN
jgi:putative hydrolase of HD superfamily